MLSRAVLLVACAAVCTLCFLSAPAFVSATSSSSQSSGSSAGGSVASAAASSSASVTPTSGYAVPPGPTDTYYVLPYTCDTPGVWAAGASLPCVPKKNDVQRYQIVLWLVIGLVIITIAAVYNLAYMSFKKDTMLYSSFNPNWETDRKRR